MTYQRIVRVRRSYNQWVANQTLEDYALRFTAKSARRWSAFRVANTALGAISFLALEAIGGAVTLSYGFTNAATAILVVGLLLFLTGLPITYYAARDGLDIDLLTRGAGFGYIGSTITSLIYASFTFIFFALEAAIMSLALEMCFGIPLSLGYVLSSIVVIPLVTHGITWISRLQLWTQPLWGFLHALPFVFLAFSGPISINDWTGYSGTRGSLDGSFDLLLFGTAATVMFSLIAQIGEQVDFLRFMPAERVTGRAAWWGSLLAAGPGWIVLGAFKLLAGSYLAVLAFASGIPLEHAAEPTQMYLIAFSNVVAQPEMALALTGTFVIVSQIKINVTNAYAGSIAWSNFFSRLTHSHPGRVVWLVFNVAIALLLMELGIYKALEQILGIYSIVAVAWVGALVADLVVNKPLGLSPGFIEFKRAHLYDINPVGVGSMAAGVGAGFLSFFGVFGDVMRALAPFAALGIPFLTAPLIAWATRSRFYIARQPTEGWMGAKALRCVICEHHFETEDMAACPAYGGPICSLCCSLDARCQDTCKTGSRLPDQVAAALRATMPSWTVEPLISKVGQYLGLLLVIAAVIAASLYLIYVQSALDPGLPMATIGETLVKVFFILLMIAGVGAWLFILAHESRTVAEEESRRQTDLLMREIEAHRRTDQKLQRAKEAAEAANQAKSRYVVGMSHELRTPLNAIFGFAQILERDQTQPREKLDAVRTIRRSAEHLAGLIEGLLDISKIEAGRLHLDRDEVHLADFLDQLEDMFSLQAETKGVTFTFERPANLPIAVYTDEKRLRQILINLLSNAVKYTERGSVNVHMTYRNQVAEFEVKDTGIGIAPDDIERIFRPFERVYVPTVQSTPGTGLGLTITKLLTEIMGGEIRVESEPGRGSRFAVRMMLSAVHEPQAPSAGKDRKAIGYVGPRLTLVIVDDDAAHRDLMVELLVPLGFSVYVAVDGPSCLTIAATVEADLYLLDVSMPGMSGWQLARLLRESGVASPVVIISADAGSRPKVRMPDDPNDDFLTKPLVLHQFLERIGSLLEIEWITEREVADRVTRYSLPLDGGPSARLIEELRQLGEIGYVRGIQSKLDEIRRDYPATGPIVGHLADLVRDFRLEDFIATLERLDHDRVRP